MYRIQLICNRYNYIYEICVNDAGGGNDGQLASQRALRVDEKTKNANKRNECNKVMESICKYEVIGGVMFIKRKALVRMTWRFFAANKSTNKKKLVDMDGKQV